MTHTKAKKIGRTKGKNRARLAKKISRNQGFYSARAGNRMIGDLRSQLKKLRGAGEVPGDALKGMTMDSLVSDFLAMGKRTMVEKALMNIDCSTGEARWEDGALFS